MPATCLDHLAEIRAAIVPAIHALGLRDVTANVYFHDGNYTVTITSGYCMNTVCRSSPDEAIGGAIRVLRLLAVAQGIDLAAWLNLRRLERETADALDLLVAGCD